MSQALVLVGHGSQRHPNSSAPLHAHADRIREDGVFDEVRTAFWKEEPALWDVRHVVQSEVAYVVPVLTSEGYFADEVFPRELGLGDEDAAYQQDGPELHYAEAVGTHESMADVLAERVDGAIEGPADEVGVAVVGHGTERNERSTATTERHAATLRERGEYDEVGALFLDEAPFVADVTDHLDADELVVVPFFVADGYHASRDVPDAMGHPGIGETATIGGRTVHYTGAVGTEPSLADVVVQRAVEVGASPNEDRMGSTAFTAPERTFVGRVAGSAEGSEWGDIHVRPTADGYELRHREDAGTPTTTLDALDGPAELREAVRLDDDGRYRPLSGAATLPTGWVLAGLDRVELTHGVDAVYPGTVAHWHREQAGVLPVTDFRETVARQSGIYADLEDLDPSEQGAATEAVCGTCVRSRRWRTDGEPPTDASDDDAIPCREACPFLLTAAHTFHESGGEAAEEADPDVPVYALEESANGYRVWYAEALPADRESDSEALQSDGGRQ